MSNTKTIVRNTGWYGIENIVSALSTLITSIAIARTLGPTKMGYMVYVMWIAALTASLGGLGIPSATSKYMAEYIGKGDRGTARFIYFRTLFLQMGLSTIVTGGLLIWLCLHAPADYRLAAILVVLSTWPAMVNSIPAQANVATENLSTNLPASIISTVVYLVLIFATVVFHWGVVGVGAAFLSMRTTDFLVRFFPTTSRIMRWDGGQHVQAEALRRRMVIFALQSIANMIVGIVVWGRSEVFLLKYLCADIRQVAFYSLAFSMADRLLVASAVFGMAAATTIFVQHGRDKSRNAAVAASSLRYLALVAIPLHFIAAALAAPALLVLYGTKYRGAEMVVTLAPVLCMPKAFLSPVYSLMQSAERQGIVIFATVLAGIVDWGIAAYLIPAHGAVGACIGSGAAQVTAIVLLWGAAIRWFNVKLPWVTVVKTALISTVAAMTAYFIVVRLTPIWGILLGGSAALSVFLGLSYVVRILEPQDYERFKIVASFLPKRIAERMLSLLSLLIRPQSTTSAAEEQMALKP
jgi:O-antigen/teichoic acid export membrane protein